MNDQQDTGSDKYPDLNLLKKGERDYPDSPDRAKLETFSNPYSNRDYLITFDCPEFTSVCPVTGQPDFGHITLEYVPDQVCIESKSLKLYLFSFRNHGVFHEEVVNQVLDDVVSASHPRRAIVTGAFNPRGGIALRVKAEYP